MCLAYASAQWVAPVPYAGFYPYAMPAVAKTQYHAQDEFGQASYGYTAPGQAAANYRDAFGNQIGSYAYINPEGKEVRVSYTADSRGFRVLSNDLPVAPKADLKAPEPVQETPEVAAARANILKLQKEAAGAAAAAPASRKKRQVFSTISPTQFYNDLMYRSVDLNQDGQPDYPVHHVLPVTPFVRSWGYPWTTPFVPAVAPISTVGTPAATASTASRKKRQVVSVVGPTEQFMDDLKYRSVDLNQDGQPDHQVTPIVPVVRQFGFGYPWMTQLAHPFYPAMSVVSAGPTVTATASAVTASRKKRQILTPYMSVAAPIPHVAPFAHVAAPVYTPLATPLVKSTFKTVTAAADPSIATPADTNMLTLKEKSFDVVNPLYHYPAVMPYHGAWF